MSTSSLSLLRCLTHAAQGDRLVPPLREAVRTNMCEWELSTLNPVLTPKGEDEYINNSDPDLFELDGKTYLYYCVSDQRTWKNEKRAVYPMPLADFLQQWFPGT